MKKVLGVIFIVIASVLSLGFVGMIPRLLSLIPMVFSGNASELAYSLAYYVLTGLYVGLIYILFKYAFKWLGKTSKSPSITIPDDPLRQNNPDKS